MIDQSCLPLPQVGRGGGECVPPIHHLLLERFSYPFSFYDEVWCMYETLDGNI